MLGNTSLPILKQRHHNKNHATIFCVHAGKSSKRHWMDIHPRISKVTTCRSKMTALKHPKSYSYTYVHLSQPGTGNNDFFLLSFFSFWSSFLWLENCHSLFNPFHLFHVFSHSCFSSLWHFHVSFLCLENGSWSLGIATRSSFTNPFRFFSFCFVCVWFWVIFLPCLWNGPGNCQQDFFLEPLSFFRSYSISFWLFSFLCLEHWPWKLLKGAGSPTLFIICLLLFFVLATFPSFASQIVLGNCQKEFFLQPFSFFFRFGMFWLFFLPLPLKLSWIIAKTSFFSNPLRFFCFVYFFQFFLFFFRSCYIP